MSAPTDLARLVTRLATCLRIELNNCELNGTGTVESGNHQEAWALIEEAERV